MTTVPTPNPISALDHYKHLANLAARYFGYVEATLDDRIQDRLQVGASPRDQDAQAAIHA